MVFLTWLMVCREKEARHRAVAGDEYSVQILVLLPAGELQQEHVQRVQDHRCRGCPGWLQVCEQ